MISLCLGLLLQAGPTTIIREATLVVESDSAARTRTSWDSRLRANPADREAILGLATIARLTWDYDGADRLYRTLIDGRPADLYSVYSRIGRAEAARIHRSLDSAATDFSQAAADARALGEGAAEAEALIGLGLVTSRLAPFDSAIRILNRAGRLARPDPALEARLRCVRAPILVNAGKPGAKEDAERGLARARQLRDNRLIGTCWQALGAWTFFNVDDPAASAPPFDSAVAYHRRARDLAGAAEAVAWSGYDHFSFFDHAAALTDFAEASSLARQSDNRFVEAWVLRLRGSVEWRTGAFASATRSISRAEGIARGLGDRLEMMHVLRMSGNVAFGQGRIDEAEAAFRETVTQAEGLGDAVAQMQGRHGLLWVNGARGDWGGAERQYRDVIAFLERNQLQGLIPGLRYSGGVIALRNRKLDQAEQAFRWYLESSSPAEYIGRYQSRARLAEIALRRGLPDSAVVELTRASDHLDSLRATLADDGLRSLAFQTGGGKFEEPDYGFARLIAAFVEGGRTGQAFRLAERRRARDLMDRLLRAATTGDSSQSAARGLWPAATEALRAPDESTAVLEYIAGRWSQPSTVFVLVGDQVTAHVLPTMDSIGPRVERFLGLIESGADTRAVGEALRRALLDPVLANLPSRIVRLLIVPDDVLHRLPFDALPLEGEPLLARFRVGLTPSATIAAALPARATRAGSGSLVVLGNPEYGSRPDDEPLAPLPFAEREARLVGRFNAAADVRLGSNASEHFLKNRPFRNGGVLHLATHAVVDDWTADRTALALAAGEGDDGFLTPGEILDLELGLDLIVLSACRTAGGPVIGGEGVQGLTAPLLAAGTRAVVATYWPIRDAGALNLIGQFYAELAEGFPVGEAIRRAKLDAMRRNAPLRDWAAFTVVGDDSVLLPLKTPRSWARWTLMTGALLAVFALGWGLRLEFHRRGANLGAVRRADQDPPVIGRPGLE